MKVGFIGLGRMGSAMARRLGDGGHDVGVYNRSAEKLKPLTEQGAKALGSIEAAATYGEAVFTMLADDAAVLDVVNQSGGLLQSLPKGGIHICAGTHSVACMQKLKSLHGEAGQVLLATPMLGRPELVASGQAGMLVGGATAAVRCSLRLRGVPLRPVPTQSRPARSRSPIISCSAAPSRRWARGFLSFANTTSCPTCSTR
jgi:3-hydroxyisobutyrate dehydrogenase-like beta-hydroxyacid dehydrogenase